MFISFFTLSSQVDEVISKENEIEKNVTVETTEGELNTEENNTESIKDDKTGLPFPKDLNVAKEDTFVLPGNNGGFHLYIRARGDIKSVLLTETTQDPKLKLHNYAYRDPNFNEINGNEKRMLNGEVLDISKGLYSLIDSTIEESTPIGRAFHICMPRIIVYSYAW